MLFTNKRLLFILLSAAVFGVLIIIYGLFLLFSPRETNNQPATPTPIHRRNIDHPNEAFPIQQDPAYIEKINREPFWDMLPHWGTNYKIDYLDSDDTIVITTFPSSGNTQQFRNEALQWIRNNGGDPASLQIEYTTSQ